MRCIECGTGELRLVPNAELPVTVRDETVTVVCEALRCPDCSYVTVPGRAMGRLMITASDAYRARHGLLTGDELRAARRRLGMTQAKFAEYLGVGIASLKRWEGSDIQGELADQTIRLKTDITYAEAAIARLQGLIQGARRPEQARAKDASATETLAEFPRPRTVRQTTNR